jgi:c-di-GMP phosphodiesterase
VKNLYNFLVKANLSDGFSKAEHKELSILKAINVFCLIEAVILLGLLLSRLIFPTGPISFVFQAIILLLLLVNIIVLRIKRDEPFSSFVLLFGNALLLINFYFIDGMGGTGIAWLFPLPILAYFIKGKNHGFRWALLYATIHATAMLLSLFTNVPLQYSGNLMVQSFFSLLCVILFIHFYERAKIRRKNLIKKQLYTDQLTQFPNRNKLVDDLNYAHDPTVMLVNIDDFKEINDFYGHIVGDFVITELGNKLAAFLTLMMPSSFEIYRLHSDEFAILLNIHLNEEEIRKVTESLYRKLEQSTFQYQDTVISVRVTFGIIVAGQTNILESADIALKLAKKRRRDYFYYIDTKALHVEEEFAANMDRTRELKSALAKDRLTVYYQPIADTQNGRVDHYECLVRLISESGKVIQPKHFLDISKRAKLYPQLSRRVIESAFSFFQDKAANFSINLSIEDILNDETAAFIFDTLSHYSMAADRVIFEILESEEIEKYSEVNRFCRRVKKMGGRIAIDDFGTGYSNWEYILRLKVDFIKIDGALIKQLDRDDISQILVKHISHFSRQLNIRTIAEYVHNQPIYELLKRFRVNYSQGYYIGRPRKKLLTS